MKTKKNMMKMKNKILVGFRLHFYFFFLLS
nr:MAG TPA: hypothetical protein [Ackermannviridae sp.]